MDRWQNLDACDARKHPDFSSMKSARMIAQIKTNVCDTEKRESSACKVEPASAAE
jgi:hypothetical protein